MMFHLGAFGAEKRGLFVKLTAPILRFEFTLKRNPISDLLKIALACAAEAIEALRNSFNRPSISRALCVSSIPL